MYIGKSIEHEVRWKNHLTSARLGCSHVFHRAIRKYGAQAFHFGILEVCDSEVESYNREVFWIAEYDTIVDNGKGYNMTYGGDGVFLTPQFEEKRIEALRKRGSDPEYKLVRSQLSTKMWESEEFRARHAIAMNKPEVLESNRQQALNRWANDPEFRAKCTAEMNRPERKEKSRKSLLETMSRPGHLERQRELWQTEEFRASHFAGVRSSENRAHQSKLMAERRKDPAVIEHYAKLAKERWDTPERRARDAQIIEMRLKEIPVTQICKTLNISYPVVYKVLDKAGVKIDGRKRKRPKCDE